MEIDEKKKPVILIVDDNPENIEVLVGALGHDLYSMRAATSGEEAFRLVKSASPPDLILLDVMMPGMDGFEVCQKIKSDIRTRKIPVIFVTSRISSEDEAKGFALGGVDYIHKPIGPAVVRSRVATHLALSNQTRELERMVSEKTKEIYDTRRDLIRRLGVAGEFRDNETGEHVLRVGRFVEILAIKSGTDREDAAILREAAQLHDVGKIGIPDHILLKPGRFNSEERKIMQAHCEIGAKIIGEHPSRLISAARRIALGHHEKWEGGGYPAAISGESIPFEARLTALADVFDALVSRRPYKEAWPVERAMNLIRIESGKSFDPELANLFLGLGDEIQEIIERYSGE